MVFLSTQLKIIKNVLTAININTKKGFDGRICYLCRSRLYRERHPVKYSLRNSVNSGLRLNKCGVELQEILGCSLEDFKNHISKQFVKGMSWNNRNKWHLDHIIPISSAKNKEECLKLNNYQNFQPLWIKDNILKSNKIPKICKLY